MLDFPDGLPRLPCRITDRREFRPVGVTASDNIQPATVTTVLCDTVLVGREDDIAFRSAKPLHFDQPQFAGLRIQAGQIVTEILLMDVGDRPARLLFVLDCNAHGHSFGFGIGPKVANLRLVGFRMRQDEGAGEAFDPLQRQRALACQLFATAFAAG